jgi:hypothetical protein
LAWNARYGRCAEARGSINCQGECEKSVTEVLCIVNPIWLQVWTTHGASTNLPEVPTPHSAGELRRDYSDDQAVEQVAMEVALIPMSGNGRADRISVSPLPAHQSHSCPQSLRLLTQYHRLSLCPFPRMQTHPPGWWIGCQGVGPIRRCHRANAPANAFTT